MLESERRQAEVKTMNLYKLSYHKGKMEKEVMGFSSDKKRRSYRGKSNEVSFWIEDVDGQEWYFKKIVEGTEEDAVNEIFTSPIYALLLDDITHPLMSQRSSRVELFYEESSSLYYTASKTLATYKDISFYKRGKARERATETEKRLESLWYSVRDKTIEELTQSDEKKNCLTQEEFDTFLEAGNLHAISIYSYNFASLWECPGTKNPYMVIADEHDEKALELLSKPKPFMEWWNIPGILELIFVCGIVGKSDILFNMGIIGDPDGECFAATVDHGFAARCSVYSCFNIMVGMLEESQKSGNYKGTGRFYMGASSNAIIVALAQNSNKLIQAIETILERHKKGYEKLTEELEERQQMLQCIISANVWRDKYKPAIDRIGTHYTRQLSTCAEILTVLQSQDLTFIHSIKPSFPDFPCSYIKNQPTGNLLTIPEVLEKTELAKQKADQERSEIKEHDEQKISLYKAISYSTVLAGCMLLYYTQRARAVMPQEGLFSKIIALPSNFAKSMLGSYFPYYFSVGQNTEVGIDERCQLM